MSTPAWIITPQFDEIVNVTDVQQIMDGMDTTLVSKSNWTEPSADRFKTPVDADGRFFEMLFTRISAIILEIQFFDDQGRTPNGTNNFRFDLVSGSTVSIFHSGKYVWIVQFAAPASYFFCTLLSLAPELETAHDSYTVCGADELDTGASANCTPIRYYQIGSAGTWVNQSGVTYDAATRNGDSMVQSRHVSGAVKAYPVINVGDDGATANIRGRFYNGITLHDNDVANGAERTIPVGEGTLGVFKAIPMDLVADVKILIRKS